jgi:hypothetical protein
MTKSLKIPELKFDLTDPHILGLSHKITFLDIETSLVDARVYRPGKQQVGAHQLTSTTRILTVAWGTLHDLLVHKDKGMWSCSNHRSPTFSKDPLDDTELLSEIWQVLDESDVVVAHNATFDKGWLLGRFLELGWKIPSRFFLYCTYRSLTKYNLTSKKLDELSRTLIDNKKIATNFELWMRCSEGEVAAFEEMEEYNLGDVYNTLFKVWMRTAYYNPEKAIDFTNPNTIEPNCRVDGSILKHIGRYHNRANGLDYNLYLNPRAGIQYIDRYNTNSGKCGLGLIRPHT